VPYNKDTIRTLQIPYQKSARRTLSLLYDQREAVRCSSPYSASTIAFGKQFLFNQGILCYVSDDQIRILDIHDRSRKERVVDFHALKSHMTSGSGPPHLPDDILRHITLLSYADDILVFLCEEAIGPGAWLFAWDIRVDDNTTTTIGPRGRVLIRRRLISKTKLFVRHNRDYLYYGTHSVRRDDGHHEWLIQGCKIDARGTASPKPVRLNEFVGSEIGSTACFEIHDGNFYALSNQTSFDTEEVDWTSCYHFVRFKLDDTNPDLKLRKIWRRQHHEGPINDAWTDLSLQPDEQTGEIKIVEVRKEWLGGGSVCGRTSYTTSFTEASDEDLILDRPNFPSNDQLSRTLDETSKPSFLEKPPIRIPKFCHRELPATASPPHEFIRAKTKHHGYHPQAHSFVDLVADEIRIPPSTRPKDRLRLRVASRLPESPLASGQLRPQISDHNDVPIPDSEEFFTSTTTSLWPPSSAPQPLFDLLCPGGRLGSVHAVADQLSIIYMAGVQHAEYGSQRAIVLVSFDPGWGHGGLERVECGFGPKMQLSTDVQLDIRMDGAPSFGPARDRFGGKAFEAAGRSPKRLLEGNTEAESSGSAAKRARVEGSASTSMSVVSEPRRVMWTEPAMYLRINQGFWVR
jgi:hypothetical protein